MRRETISICSEIIGKQFYPKLPNWAEVFGLICLDQSLQIQNKERKCRHMQTLEMLGEKYFDHLCSLGKNILNLEIFNAWASRDETVRIGFMLILIISVIFYKTSIRGCDLNYSRVIVFKSKPDWLVLLVRGGQLGKLSEVRYDWHCDVFIFILSTRVITQNYVNLTPNKQPDQRGLSCTITECEVRGEMKDIDIHLDTAHQQHSLVPRRG